jgi:hypothetical protein
MHAALMNGRTRFSKEATTATNCACCNSSKLRSVGNGGPDISQSTNATIACGVNNETTNSTCLSRTVRPTELGTRDAWMQRIGARQLMEVVKRCCTTQ